LITAIVLIPHPNPFFAIPFGSSQVDAVVRAVAMPIALRFLTVVLVIWDEDTNTGSRGGVGIGRAWIGTTGASYGAGGIMVAGCQVMGIRTVLEGLGGYDSSGPWIATVAACSIVVGGLAARAVVGRWAREVGLGGAGCKGIAEVRWGEGEI